VVVPAGGDVMMTPGESLELAVLRGVAKAAKGLADELRDAELALRRVRKVADERGAEIERLRARIVELESRLVSTLVTLDSRTTAKPLPWGRTPMLDGQHADEPQPPVQRPPVHWPTFHRDSCGKTIGRLQSDIATLVTCPVCLSQAQLHAEQDDGATDGDRDG